MLNAVAAIAAGVTGRTDHWAGRSLGCYAIDGKAAILKRAAEVANRSLVCKMLPGSAFGHERAMAKGDRLNPSS